MRLSGDVMVLNKRILRDLKQNFLRYFAVFIVISIAMYVVVGMAGSAETVMNGVKEHAEQNAVEDGQFSVFVPLNIEEINYIENLGVIVEDHSNVDFRVNETTLRIFTNRKQIDKLELDDGRIASTSGEVTLEKNYCKANNIKLDDTIQIASRSFVVVGIGSTPDYDDVLQNLTDASSNPLLFGTAFLTDSDYKALIDSSESLSTEENQYAYIITGNITQDELREEIGKLKFDLPSVKDKFAYDYFSKAEEAKNEFADGINEISDSSKKISDSANQIVEAVTPFGVIGSEINKAADGLSNAATELDKGVDNLNSSFEEFSDEYLNFTYTNLKEFTKADNNARINASSDDIKINKTGALIAGVIVLILLAYILSAFVTSTIEKERKVIGTLYSLGFSKKELITHYLVLPLVICLLGGLVGTFAGFLSMGSQMAENSGYYSYPQLDYVYPLYLIIYGIVVPFVMALVVNLVCINKKLSKEPLSLMRKEIRSYTYDGLNLGNMKFINRFRIKLFMREIKSYLTIALGVFISLLLVVFAFCIYSALTSIVTETNNDVKFNYMYYLSYPEKEVPYNAEEAYMKKLSKSTLGYDFDVSILGIDEKSTSFPYNIKTNTDELYISTSVAEKYGIAVGDNFSLDDEINNVTYNFKVKEIVSYAPGLFVFMDIDEMRERFGKEDDYYNVLLSQEKLNIDPGRIYSTTTAQDLRDASEIFMKLMQSLIYVLIFASVILFILVMYLMVKMIIERQTTNISMFKVFGYTKSEISKLYMRNNLYTVLVSATLFIPLSRYIIVKIYPFMVANRAVGFNLSFSLEVYIFILGLIMVSYFLSYIFAKIKLNKISIQEMLKDRE